MSVGERLTERRQELGWTQVQLAEAAELTPSAISLFESNKRKPSFEALRKLGMALRVSAGYFTDEDQAELPLVSDPRLERIIHGFGLLDGPGRDQVTELVTQLLARRAGGYRSPGLISAPRQAALELLEQVGQRFAPIDPFLIATLLGITVRMAALDNEDYEAIIEQQVYPPLILLAQGERIPDTRLRFTLAHLLAHFVLENHRQYRYTCRPLFSGGDHSATEREADEFAAELLVPQTVLAKLDPDIREGKRPHPSADQALSIAHRCRASVPVTFLQYVRYSPFPCACLLTQGGKIRDMAVSASFTYTLSGQLPPEARCLTTMGQKGVQSREWMGGEWLTDQGAGEIRLLEEAFHYNPSAEQSVTLLTIMDR
jgi:transcriptional regulator with XRE-family HTH domain